MENNKNVNEQTVETVYDADLYLQNDAADDAFSGGDGYSAPMRKTITSVRHRTRMSNGFMYRLMIEKGAFLSILAFIIPAAIMTFAFAQSGVHPFGKRQILVVDLWHQYYPFFRVVREKLLTGGSFFYSWQNGMGSNFLSLISYYAMSPLNWLSIFFSEKYVRDALTFVFILKIGFSGAFFSCFLRYTYKRNDYSVVFFSVMYALCSFTLGYYWNVMWFDTIALFPLVMLGIVAICREGKWKTFTFALTLSLTTNYYIAFFTCIFSIFMFMAASIIEFKSIKTWLHRFWIMLRSSVLGLGLAAFILLPAYFGLELTFSDDNRNLIEKFKYIFRQKTVFYEKWQDIFANTLSYSMPTKVEGLPNIACGMLALMLFGIFLLSLKVKIREKVSVLAMLFIIIYSCNFNKLNYIWHGFHYTNQIPYRFAFIFSFVLVAAAFRAYDVILRHGIKIPHFIFALLAPGVVFYLNYHTTVKHPRDDQAVKSSLIILGAYWLIFLAAKVFPFKKKSVRNVLLSLALSAAVFSEFISNAKLGVKTVDTTSYNGYPTCSDEIDALLKAAAKTDDSLFYRTEVTNTYTLNDSALYGYNGISQFSSAANVSVTRLCRRFGLYASEAGNRFYYRTSTPVFNSMFGIKYLINKNGSLFSEEDFFEYSGNAQSICMYKNKYPLSIGYMVNEEILEIPYGDGANPFEYQNDVLKLAAGLKTSCFNAIVAKPIDYVNMESSRYGYGSYSYKIEEKSRAASATYTFTGLKDSTLYGYAGCTSKSVKNIVIKRNDKILDRGDLIEKYPVAFPMGANSPDDKSTIELTMNPDVESGNYQLVVYAMNNKLFEEAYNNLADEQLELSSFGDKDITGTITAKKDGIMFLSIPYENGWRVYVDGEEAETFKVLDAMLGVRVSEGTHDIHIEYVPEGFAAGLVISTVSAVFTGALICFDIRRKRSRRRRYAEIAANNHTPAGDDPDLLALIHSEPETEEGAPDSAEAVPADDENVIPEETTTPTEAENAEPESNDSIQGD